MDIINWLGRKNSMEPQSITALFDNLAAHLLAQAELFSILRYEAKVVASHVLKPVLLLLHFL